MLPRKKSIEQFNKIIKMSRKTDIGVRTEGKKLANEISIKNNLKHIDSYEDYMKKN